MFFQVPVIKQNPQELSENESMGWISSSSRFAHRSLAGESSSGWHGKHHHFCKSLQEETDGDVLCLETLLRGSKWLSSKYWGWMDLSLWVNPNSNILLMSDNLQNQRRRPAKVLFCCLMFAQLKLHSSQPLRSPDFPIPSAQCKLGRSPVSHTKPTACAHSEIGHTLTPWVTRFCPDFRRTSPPQEHAGFPSALVISQDNSTRIGLHLGFQEKASFYPSAYCEPGIVDLCTRFFHFHPHCCLWLTDASLSSVGEVPQPCLLTLLLLPGLFLLPTGAMRHLPRVTQTPVQPILTCRALPHGHTFIQKLFLVLLMFWRVIQKKQTHPFCNNHLSPSADQQ